MQLAVKPSRRQEAIMSALFSSATLFADGFVYSLMRQGSSVRELVSVRMINSLKRDGWIDDHYRLTRAGWEMLLQLDRERARTKAQ